MDNLQIAKNLVMYRKQKGYTQMELATKINYSDKVISKWERGESLPGIEALQVLASLYDTTVDHLINGYTEEENDTFILNIKQTQGPSTFLKYSIYIPIALFLALTVHALYDSPSFLWVLSMGALFIYTIVYTIVICYVTYEGNYEGHKIVLINKPASCNLYIDNKLVDSNTNLFSFGMALTGKANRRTIKAKVSFNFQFKCQMFVE